MCRLVAYLGAPIRMNDVLSKPKDSLIKQSVSAMESDIVVNGDGFGIGWYSPRVSDRPAVFVSILPAWNDLNLRNISHLVSSPCFFGHVRAALLGGVSHDNCHPFRYEQYLFMHNGAIGEFVKIKRDLLNLLSEESFASIHGQTDSEVMFALWRTHFFETDRSLQAMVEAFRKTFKTIQGLQQKHHIKTPSHINVVISDGKQLVAVRSSTDPEYYLSLHYLQGVAFKHDNAHCYMTEVGTKTPTSIIIASETLTQDKAAWQDVPEQTIMTVDAAQKLEFHEID